jgi:hypothetical protein
MIAEGRCFDEVDRINGDSASPSVPGFDGGRLVQKWKMLSQFEKNLHNRVSIMT